MNIMQYESVSLNDNEKSLVILDQTKLPNEIKFLHLKTQNEIRNAIYTLQVRGAPAIGIAAAFGLYLASTQINTNDYDTFMQELRSAKDYLNSSRPTAVNLSWALNRLERTATNHSDKSIPELREILRREAIAIKNEDTEMCRKIGEHGLTVIKDGDGILTHCNAGQLATSKYGTALAPIHLGRERGMNFHVYCDETRPLLQGARLSTFELLADGVDTTLICDNMASQVMKNGWINAVLVGCDRVASNGDSCNKIGTSGLAILAKHYGIPFYVLGPTSTIDMSISSGKEIIIEERMSTEIFNSWLTNPNALEGLKVYNPAFDVTDHELITGIITEHGISYPPYTESLKKIFAD